MIYVRNLLKTPNGLSPPSLFILKIIHKYVYLFSYFTFYNFTVSCSSKELELKGNEMGLNKCRRIILCQCLDSQQTQAQNKAQLISSHRPNVTLLEGALAETCQHPVIIRRQLHLRCEDSRVIMFCRKNKPTLMQHGTAWAELASTCQIGLR